MTEAEGRRVYGRLWRRYYVECRHCGLKRFLSNHWPIAMLKWWGGLLHGEWNQDCPSGRPGWMDFKDARRGGRHGR